MTGENTDASRSDEELVVQAREGEERAFETLVRRYERMVFGMVYGMVGASDAKDVAQEVFLAAYRSLSRFRGESSFKTWLAKIVMYRTASFHRRRAVRVTLPLESSRPEEGPAFLEIPDSSSNPETVWSDRERQYRVDRALERLPLEYRQALALRVQEGLSYEEIARVMACSLGTVKSRLHNAKALMARYLREEAS